MATLIVTTNSDSGVDNTTDTDLATDMSDGGGLSLREAIGNAQSGDVIVFDLDSDTDGSQGGTITFGPNAPLVISTSLTINGDVDDDGVADVTIDADGASRVFTVSDGSSTFNGLVVTGAYGNSSSSGGGFSLTTTGTTTISNSVITDNVSGYGGGIWKSDGTLEISNSLISNNTAYYGGGLYHSGGNTTISNTIITGNVGDLGGGINLRSGTAAISDTTISGNVPLYPSADDASELRVSGATVMVEDSIIAGNNNTTAANIIDVSGGVTFSGDVFLSEAFTPTSGSYTLDTLGNIFASTENITRNSQSITRGELADGDRVVDWIEPASGITAGAFPTSLNPNTDPVIDTMPEEDLTFTEDGNLLYLASTGTLSDSDGNDDWDGGTLVIQITANNTDADEIGILDDDDDSIDISVSGTNLIADSVTVGTVSASGGTVTDGTALTITFNENATNDIVQEVLQSVTYENTSDEPSTLTRTVTFTATDANSGSDTETKEVSVQAVNDEPEVSVTAFNPTFVQHGANVNLFSDAELDPIETGQTIAGFTLYVTGVVDEGDEYLYINNTTVTLIDGNSGAWGSMTFSVRASGDALRVEISGATLSQSEAENLVENISYGNSADNPTVANTRTISLSDIADSGGSSASGGTGSTVTVALDADPTFTGLPTDIYVEIEEASNIDLSAATVADADSDFVTLVLSVDTGSLTAVREGEIRVSDTSQGDGMRSRLQIEGKTLSADLVDKSLATGTRITLSGSIDNVNAYLSDPANIQYTSATGVKGNDAATLTIQIGSNERNLDTLATINLDIGYSNTNSAPHSISLNGSSVMENAPGAAIGTVSATDPDGDAISYSVTDSRFEIVGTTLKLKDGVSLDYEDDKSVRVGVNATDTAGNSSRIYFNIIVGDVRETTGTDDAEQLTGSNDDDNVFAAGGNDTVEAGDGRDTIDGGAGDDSLSGGNDDDRIKGGDGDDLVDGGSGRDTLRGGVGDDDVRSGDDNDKVFAGVGDAGNDTISGGSGNDSLGGGAGDDSISGDEGDDLIWGRDGNDVIAGGAGDDMLYNGAGNDTVSGGVGDDTLWGSGGDDIFTGGEGADVFAFRNATGNDTITDFDAIDDSLSFDISVGMTTKDEVVAASSDATVAGESGVLIDLGGGESIFLIDLSLSDLADVTMTF
ncbi:hypothetical protein [Kordiimonas sp.]|uniref:hypothetical protein n=1 Tax=Kordiimonas sp. TaxID=1970157 RepID=UPI003A93A6E1